MGVIDLDARVKKLEQEAGGGAVIDQLEAAVTALEEQINGDGETDLGLAGDVAALEETVNGDGETDFGLVGDVAALDNARPTVFSTTEKVVGEWINNDPVYQKVIDIGNEVYIPYSSWETTSIVISDIKGIISAWGVGDTDNKTCTPLMASHDETGALLFQTPRNGTNSLVKYVILQYTKTEAE